MDFTKMWCNYPRGKRPCSDENNIPNFENQCAIRMGEVLKAEGLDLDDFEGATCWHHPSEKHALRAEELAKYLDKRWKADRVIRKESLEGQPILADDFACETGIICFYDFYGEGNTGDHIDLWNGEETTSGPHEDYFERSSKVALWLVD